MDQNWRECRNMFGQ